MFDTIFARRRAADDRRFDDALDQLVTEQASAEHLARTDVERAEYETAKLLGATLGPMREPPPITRERVWRDVQARIAAGPTTAQPGIAAPAVVALRPALRRRLPIALAGAVVLLLLALTVPLLWRQQEGTAPSGPAAALLRSAEAATLTVPPGQVLHCTSTSTHTRADGRPPWVTTTETWLDPQRRLGRADSRFEGAPRAPASGSVRAVYDGAAGWRYESGKGLSGVPMPEYAAFERLFPCALQDDLAKLQQALGAGSAPATLSEGTLDGVPVTVLSLAVDPLDVKTATAIFGAYPVKPERWFDPLPVRYTFTRDGGHLVRVESWTVGYEATQPPIKAVVLGPREQRLRYELVPAEQYPASFFTAEAIAQP